jgi:hypothetical protein
MQRRNRRFTGSAAPSHHRRGRELTSAKMDAAWPFSRGPEIFLAALVPGILGVVFAVRSRRPPRLRSLGIALPLGFAILFLASCGGASSGSGGGGGGNTGNPGTPPGSYTIIVNATTGGSSPITATTTFTLVVQANQNSGTGGQAQGVYVGNTSTGLAFDGIILPNDQFYAIYGNQVGNVFYVCGLATGQGASASGKYTATENDFDYCAGGLSIFSGSVSGTYTPGVSLSGTLSENGTSESFSGTAPSSSLFNYNTAASLSQISGPWNGTLTDGETSSFVVNSSGSASGVSSSGCAYSAQITPDSSNKNFFDVSLTFGGSPCSLPNQSATGIAVNYLLSDGVTNQLIAAVHSGSSFGIVFAGQR